MTRIRSTIFLLIALLVGIATANAATTAPYDPSANAGAQVQAALNKAKNNHKPVLIFFGANWCPDCRALAKTISKGRDARLLHSHFNIVKVDVGQFNRNLDIAKRYNNPIKMGIPAAAIVSPSGQVEYTTRAGQLANARHMSANDVYQLFEKAIAKTNAS